MGTVKPSPDAKEIAELLKKYRIESLFHFTCVDNLETIAKCGALCSKSSLETNGFLDNIITGGNDLSIRLDIQCDNWDKVHLYFCPQTPMAYRVQQRADREKPAQSGHICYLILSPTVALWEGIFFTDTNATQLIDRHNRDQGLVGLQLVDLETIRNQLDRITVPKQIWKRNVQAECLVPGSIPLDHVKGISFISEASLKEGTRLWGEKPHPPFKVEKRLFHSGFPVVENYFATSSEVTVDNVNTSQFKNDKIFEYRTDSNITVLVNLQAVACIEGKFVWADSSGRVVKETTTEFEKSQGYWHWASIPIKEIGHGICSADYYLADIRWFRAVFDVRR